MMYRLKCGALVLFMTFSSLMMNGQQGDVVVPGTGFINVGSDSMLISQRPVTNREYLIYLMWLCHTQGVDYPEVFFSAIPGFSVREYHTYYFDFYDSKGNLILGPLLKHTQPFVKNYMLNPKYIDYPVIGISWWQANRYCKWLSDRFNEYKLVRDGYYKPDPYQANEECFVTEAYLAKMYYGLRAVGKENVYLNWQDRLLVPAFRIPTTREIEMAEKQNKLTTDFKPYPFEDNNFLNQWNKWYIVSHETKLILKYSDFSKPFVIKLSDQMWDLDQKSYSEIPFDMDHARENYSIIDLYKLHGQNPFNIQDNEDQYKDSLGQMQYIIIDENNKKEPIAVERFERSDPAAGNILKFFFFRFSVAIKPGQYKL